MRGGQDGHRFHQVIAPLQIAHLHGGDTLLFRLLLFLALDLLQAIEAHVFNGLAEILRLLQDVFAVDFERSIPRIITQGVTGVGALLLLGVSSLACSLVVWLAQQLQTLLMRQ
jgi:hypothetical protein